MQNQSRKDLTYQWVCIKQTFLDKLLLIYICNLYKKYLHACINIVYFRALMNF